MKALHSNLITNKFNIASILNLFVSALLLIPMFISFNAFSAAGDLISNSATISYDIGGVPTATSASVAFTEDRKINFVVTADNGGLSVPVISSMTNAILQFVITNTGNDTHDFLITATNTLLNPFSLPADNFNPLAGTVKTFVESNVTPGYQAAQDVELFVDELAPNISQVVYIIADMPAFGSGEVVAAMSLITQVAEGGSIGIEGTYINADDNSRISPASVAVGDFSNGGTNVPVGTAVTNADTLAMETVFNDPAGLNTEDLSSDLVQDIVGNGQHVDSAAFEVKSPVSIVKSLTVIDTLGGNDPHPGATLRYQLDVTVIGNVAIDNLIISDDIPADTTYTDESITLNGVVQTDVIDVPADYSRAIDISVKPVASIEVDLSKGGAVAVPNGVTNTIIFEVTID